MSPIKRPDRGKEGRSREIKTWHTYQKDINFLGEWIQFAFVIIDMLHEVCFPIVFKWSNMRDFKKTKKLILFICTIWHFNLISRWWQLIKNTKHQDYSICLKRRATRTTCSALLEYRCVCVCRTIQISGKWLSILMERDPFISHSFAHLSVDESC
jgi:hypothetical protein